MHMNRLLRYAFPMACLILFFSACSSGGTVTPTPTASHTVTVGTTPTNNLSPSVTTAPVPPTLTSCPVAGTARAAVIAPLALGRNANIVYMTMEFSNGTYTTILNRFDVATGAKTVIIKLDNQIIRFPQLSADGQWILFDQSTVQQDKLQMVRMDGQGLQTLYCGSALSNIIWSTDQHSVLFGATSSPQGNYGIFLLDTQHGTIQVELKPTQTNLGSSGVFPITWLDNTRAYVSFTNAPIAPFDRLGLLDTSRGPNQSMSDITLVYQDNTSTAFNYPCWDADSSYDASTLFVAKCSGISAPNCSGSCSLGTREGPSTIYTEPGGGGSQQALLTSQALGIAAVRSVTNTTLLLQVENFSQNHQVDTSQNGLWTVHSDGTGLMRLTTEASGASTTLCKFSQQPWSNVSRDSSMYAFETSTSGNPATYTLFYGSLNGGQPQSFVSVSNNNSSANGTNLAIVGWTTMS